MTTSAPKPLSLNTFSNGPRGFLYEPSLHLCLPKQLTIVARAIKSSYNSSAVIAGSPKESF